MQALNTVCLCCFLLILTDIIVSGVDRNCSRDVSTFLPSPALPFFSFPPLPLVVGPLNQLGLESTVSSPSGVRGGATTEKEFGVL